MFKTVFAAFLAGSLIATSIGLLKDRESEAEVLSGPFEISAGQTDLSVVQAEVTPCSKAISALDQRITFFGRRALASASWLDLEQVASAYLARAHLTGRWEDYAQAEEALREAFNQAPKKSGPFLTRARLSFALHRFDRVEEDLRAAESGILLGASARALILEMRADLLLHRGRYEEAGAAYVRTLASGRTVTALARLASYRRQTGDHDQADALLGEAIGKTSDPQTLAWIELQRGETDADRGRLRAALAHFEAGDRAFGGWHVLEERIARTLGAMGNERTALAAYRQLVTRHGNPDHMHDLARMLEDQGRFAEAGRLHTEADRLYQSRAERFPEAFSGHVLTHLLAHRDGARAVRLAEQNHRIRPNAESLTLLAQAYLLADRIEDAEATINEALKTPASTAALHATAAHVLRAAGDEEVAKKQQSIADAMDPSAYRRLDYLR